MAFPRSGVRLALKRPSASSTATTCTRLPWFSRSTTCNDRYIEHEIIGTCRKLGIGITTFSPLAQGLLTGKYRKGQPLPAGSRATWQSDHQINESARP